MKTMTRWGMGGVALGLVVSGALTVTAESQPWAAASTPSSSASWPYANGDLANSRDVIGSNITSANVSQLKVAWTFKIPGKAAKSYFELGLLVANPVVVDGVAYLQDINSNVYAISLLTGKLAWEYYIDKPLISGPGPNGVAVADGVVFGLTPKTAFALSATSGDVIWVDKNLLKKGQGTFGMQPQAANGRVYIASQYGSGPGGGVLMALRMTNGHKLWGFNTVTSEAPGVQALGVGAGGAWETPLVGTDGSVTYGTGNPYQSLGSAINTPERQLYTDSDVNLNAATGQLRWFYQGVPNDFKDYDMQASPIAASVNGTPVVLGGGKMGIVYEMNALTGHLIWKTPVGEHNGHDNDSLNMLEHQDIPKVPFAYDPGSLGGILTNMAVADGSVYVATNDVELQFTSLGDSDIDGTTVKHETETGEVEALSLATGKVEWDTKVSELPLGATTVVNDLVFTTLYDGQLIALNRATGAIVCRIKLPTSTNATIAVAGNTILVPTGGPVTGEKAGKDTGGGNPQLVAYRLP